MNRILHSKNKKWAWTALVIFILSGGIYWITQKKEKPKTTYHEVQVKRTDFTDTILSTGSVAPENRLDIKSPVAGRIEKLLVQEGQHVKKGQILAWISSTERAAMLDSARAEGEKELSQWEGYYKPTPIYAPIDGVLILQNIWPGQSFLTSDAILTMSDRLTVKAQVDETDISKVKLGQSATILLDAYPDDKIEARVVHVAYDAKTINSVTTYIVDVLPKVVPKHMLSGMTANVTFILNQIKDSLMIPSEAISTENDQACVKLKPAHADDKPVCQKIEVGSANDTMTVVSSGLSENQIILVPDLKKLSPKADAASNPFGMPNSGRRH